MKAPHRARAGEWWYVVATIAMFVFSPELRRLVDWRTHFNAISVLSIVPTLMLLPLAILVYRRRRRLSHTAFAAVAAAWTIACAYGFVVALVYRHPAAGLFGLSQFALPLAIGAWLATGEDDMRIAFSRLSAPLLAFGAVASAYGVYQYVVAPPWDTAWMTSLTALSFGEPVPFGIRVYSVLNSPGPFAAFLLIAVLFNMPRMRLADRWVVFATMLCLAGLALSLVRSAWISLVVGVLVYLVFSPRRGAALGSLAVLGGCVVAAAAAFAVSQSDVTSEALALRFASFSQAGEDYSAQARSDSAASALQEAFSRPAGVGLGMTGVGNKLVGDEPGFAFLGDVIDEGYVSRLLEMGLPGFAGFAVFFAGGLVIAVRAHRFFLRHGDVAAATLTSAMLAVQAAVLTMQLAGDNISGLTLVLYASAMALPALGSRRPVVTG